MRSNDGLNRLLNRLTDNEACRAGERLAYLYTLHKPHTWQKKVIETVLRLAGTTAPTFVQCGRKWGKTETAAFIIYLHSCLVRNPHVYYIAPFYKQAKEILWAPKRIQNFAPDLREGRPNEAEMRIPLINNGFVKLDGADNIDSARGFTPSLVIYDEYKDFKPGFHVAMEPNFAARNAWHVVLGTPPEQETEYFALAQIAKDHGSHFERPTSDNPHIDPEWLKTKKTELFQRGEQDVWYREYEGKFVRGGKNSIFPMFNEQSIKSDDEIFDEIEPIRNKLEWYTIADPGTVSVFGVLFMAINRYTKDIYILDEIYEEEVAKTSVDNIYPKIAEIEDDIGAKEPFAIADNAAQWFILEASQRYGRHFAATHKHYNKKDAGLSLIKDIILAGRLKVSAQCKNFIWEMQNYVRDHLGRIPKENDHLIDCFRYGLGTANYVLNEDKERTKREREMAEQIRYYRPKDDFPQFFSESQDPLADEFIAEDQQAWGEAFND